MDQQSLCLLIQYIPFLMLSVRLLKEENVEGEKEKCSLFALGGQTISHSQIPPDNG